MPLKYIISRLRGSLSFSDAVTFLNLEYSRDETKNEDLDDMSNIEYEDIQDQSPGIHVKVDAQPQIPFIAIGGAGTRIGRLIQHRLEGYGMKYPVLFVDTDKKSLDQYTQASHKIHIKGSTEGTTHQFLKGQARAKNNSDEVTETITKYLEELKLQYDHEIVFMLLGSGGTGIGVGIEIAKTLIMMGKRPVPILVLPDKSEMTRIRFNAAVGLYHFSYAPKNRGMNLVTICIDNGLFLEQNSREYLTSVLSKANERIAATLGDIIASTCIESHAYSSDLNEFLEIFRDIKGVAALQYIQLMDYRNLYEEYEKLIETSLSLDIDPSKATRGYMYLSSNKDKIIAQDYRNLLMNFQFTDIFHKMHEVELEDNFVSYRGIFTGIKYPDYIEELIQEAENVRITILEDEKNKSSKGNVNPKIDRLSGDHELDVELNKGE